MNQQIVRFIKKIPPLYHFTRYSYISLVFAKSLLLDPPTIRNKYYGEIKKTQIDKSIPLFLDRQHEIREFFNISSFYLLKYYSKYGFPNTDRFKEYYISNFFEGNTTSDKLKQAYDSACFPYTLRLMLAYERYSIITDYLDFMIKDSCKNLNEFNVLDYGCGVSDIGLLFASFGAEVTICDLDNKRFDFTVWRFKKRGFNPEKMRVTDTEVYPELPESKFDLILATEIFEHVRNPFKLLKSFTKSLKDGGYLFDSMGGKFERDDRSHHLKESFKIGNSKEYKEYYNAHYIHLSPQKGLNYLFKKLI